jgi:hypothetical protein
MDLKTQNHTKSRKSDKGTTIVELLVPLLIYFLIVLISLPLLCSKNAGACINLSSGALGIQAFPLTAGLIIYLLKVLDLRHRVNWVGVVIANFKGYVKQHLSDDEMRTLAIISFLLYFILGTFVFAFIFRFIFAGMDATDYSLIAFILSPFLWIVALLFLSWKSNQS